MNFVAPVPSSRKRLAMKSPAVAVVPPPSTAGDTYMGVLVKLMEIGDQLKIQAIAIEHARERAAKRDWPGVQIGLAVLCCTAGDIRKIAAQINEKIGPDMDSATLAYGEKQ